MIAILIEHTAGKWPFWLSPRQAAIVPVDPKFNEYAEQVRIRDSESAINTDTREGEKGRGGQCEIMFGGKWVGA